ncbi:O-antigen ligase domain-containing protein [Arachnia propionica]|uniref:O-antigen ligase domain-containing protein n=1 Tax=Arachnia propionica TaxID=1750 RepID=A0A3P1T969_9ACTN|nr:O-antigen ligase family protein [Arachnia propionica]MDO5084709.1 O-antigen ligase family protein [Arachnia propionica]RRD05725.1 O-antigen ligase domain-containing protein [Arachnia propionica]
MLRFVPDPSRQVSRRPWDPWTRTALAVISVILLAATIAVMETPVGRTGLSAFTVLLAPALSVLVLATLLHRSGRIRTAPPSRALVVGAGSFVLLLGWAAATVPMSEPRVSVAWGDPDTAVRVPLIFLLGPLLTALMTVATAVLAVGLVHPRRLFHAAWWLSMASAVVTPLGVAWEAANNDLYGRLATRVGGAAVLHIALLLALAVCLGAALQGYRRLLSCLGALAHLGYLLATGARAGLITLAVFMALMTVTTVVGSVRSRPQLIPLFTSGVVVVFSGFAVVAMRVLTTRGFDPTGGGRTETWAYGLAQSFSSLPRTVFGMGYGVLWPWYGFEAKVVPQPGAHYDKQMPGGLTLSHAHNLYVAVLAELGLVGLIALLVVVAVTLWTLLSAKGPFEKTLAAALTASLVGFAFDTVLIKNFPVSLIWWLALAALLTMQSHRRREEQRHLAWEQALLRIGVR